MRAFDAFSGHDLTSAPSRGSYGLGPYYPGGSTKLLDFVGGNVGQVAALMAPICRSAIKDKSY